MRASSSGEQQITYEIESHCVDSSLAFLRPVWSNAVSMTFFSGALHE